MAALRKLDYQRVAALCVLLVSAETFRNGGVPGRDAKVGDDQVLVLSAIEIAARRLRVDCASPLSSALSSALASIAAANPGSSHAAVVAARLAAFESALRAMGATADALQAEHAAMTADDAAYSTFVAPIEAIFASLADYVSALYVRALPTLARPDVLLETAHLHEHQTTDMLDASAITGTCRVDDGDRQTSIVGLGLRDDAVGWDSLCQLPYVLMHELLCHAFQGLVGQGRRAASTGCGWSEGWMDALAVRLLAFWLEGEVEGAPRWFLEEPHVVLRAGSRLHDRRREPQSGLQPTDLSQRRAMHAAAYRLERMLRGDNIRGGHALVRLVNFSLRLNLHAVPQRERNDTIDRLALALELYHGERLSRVVGACSRVFEHGDWNVFRDEIEKLTTLRA